MDTSKIVMYGAFSLFAVLYILFYLGVDNLENNTFYKIQLI